MRCDTRCCAVAQCVHAEIRKKLHICVEHASILKHAKRCIAKNGKFFGNVSMLKYSVQPIPAAAVAAAHGADRAGWLGGDDALRYGLM